MTPPVPSTVIACRSTASAGIDGATSTMGATAEVMGRPPGSRGFALVYRAGPDGASDRELSGLCHTLSSRGPSMLSLLTCALWIVASPPAAPQVHRMAISVRGPLALVK